MLETTLLKHEQLTAAGAFTQTQYSEARTFYSCCYLQTETAAADFIILYRDNNACFKEQLK